jgi:hypothetical protein
VVANSWSSETLMSQISRVQPIKKSICHSNARRRTGKICIIQVVVEINTRKNYYNFCVSFLEGHLLHKGTKATSRQTKIIYHDLDDSRLVVRANDLLGAHTFSRERDKLTDYLYQILLRGIIKSEEARRENFLVKVKNLRQPKCI